MTCRDWTHFWLNEGFATFMAAAYQEQRAGRDAYLREIDAARTAYEKVRAAGHDRSLVFPDWTQPAADDRTLVYQKGAYVLHRLRETMGEQAFWSGLRKYTRTYAGQSVTTADFQKAMEQASGRDLSGFFAEWVYLTKPQASVTEPVDVGDRDLSSRVHLDSFSPHKSHPCIPNRDETRTLPYSSASRA